MIEPRVISAGRPGERVAALGAALAAHQTGPTQLAQDRLDELARQGLVADHDVDLDQIGLARGQAQQGPHRVVGLGRDLHAAILSGPSGGVALAPGRISRGRDSGERRRVVRRAQPRLVADREPEPLGLAPGQLHPRLATAGVEFGPHLEADALQPGYRRRDRARLVGR